MATKKEKVGLVSLGIFLGLVISLSLLWWNKSLMNTDWFTFPKVRSYVQQLFDRDSDFLTQIDPDKRNTGPYLTQKNLNEADSLNNDGNDSLFAADSSGLNYFMENGAMEYYIESDRTTDSLDNLFYGAGKQIRSSDSATTDTLSSGKNSAPGDAKIKRDQFLLSRNYKVAGLADSTGNTIAKLDSLLTFDHYTHRSKGNVFKIEFWQSPVHYTGYKMLANKIVLFGNFNPDEVSLQYQNNSFYMHYRNNSYLLEFTPEFQSLYNRKKSERK